jgi:hypothetical protein
MKFIENKNIWGLGPIPNPKTSMFRKYIKKLILN